MIIFDLDGTLALTDHRRHFVMPQVGETYISPKGQQWTVLAVEGKLLYVKNKFGVKTHLSWKAAGFKPDWDAFYAACVDDKPNKAVVEVFQRLVDHEIIEIWSGRPDRVREETRIWLARHVCQLIPLRMRRDGDNTPDDELKRGWLQKARAAGKTIEYVFDDRDKVVTMWRAEGVPCFQVAPGDF